MKVIELLGALGENQQFDIRTKDGERIDYQTAVEHEAKVLDISAIEKNHIRIDTNFSWYM